MARMRGFSLIELMVALVLGLLLTAGALGIFLSAREAFRTTEELSRVQESARTAFEVMARDVREAGNAHCGTGVRAVHISRGMDEKYWKNWNTYLIGISGNDTFVDNWFPMGRGAGARVAGLDALEIYSTEDLGMYVTEAMPSYNSDLTVNAVPADVNASDVLIACDFRLSTLFRATAVTSNSVSHAQGQRAGDNLSSGFARDTSLLGSDDSKVPASAWHLYGKNTAVTRLRVWTWYIGINTKGGKSLYRGKRSDGSRSDGSKYELVEVSEGVSAMSLTYLAEGQNAYIRAESVADWSKVKAVRVELTLEGEGKTNTFGNQGVLARKVTAVMAARNRNL